MKNFFDQLSPSMKKGLLALLALIAVFFGYEVSDVPFDFASPTDSTIEQSTPSSQSAAEVSYGERYSSPEDVALYLHEYEELPPNYLTKKEAEAAGWEQSKGNLWDVTDQMAIGGDRFGNYEQQLPDEDNYYEADVNYQGGYRGSERIVYSDDGDIYYTEDHYESFEQLYEGE